jgi:iron-sulfur cluster repair protein YtfE (RIC family)
MLNKFHEMTPPALVMLAPVSGPVDNMGQGAPRPGVRHRRGPRIPDTLFTPASHRDALIAAYPELKPACDQLSFGSDMSLERWCTSPEWALLVLARAAKPPPATPACNWSQAELFELIDDLIDHHHRQLRNELQRLDILVSMLAHRHEDDCILALERSFMRFKRQLETHLDQEEAEVFPQCLAIATASRGHPAADCMHIDVTTGIRAMLIGHDDASTEFADVQEHSGASVQEMTDMDLDLIRTGLLAMKADYLVHATKEKEILVPAALCAEDQLRARMGAAKIASGPDPAKANRKSYAR